MARKYLDTTGLTALWAKIVAKINAIGDSFVQKAGDTMTGRLTVQGDAGGSWVSSQDVNQAAIKVDGTATNGQRYDTIISNECYSGATITIGRITNQLCFGYVKAGQTDNYLAKFMNFEPENGHGKVTFGTNGAAKSYIDLSDGYYSGKAANATLWNGITMEMGTNNTTDTWVPVQTGSKWQHRVIPTDYNNKIIGEDNHAASTGAALSSDTGRIGLHWYSQTGKIKNQPAQYGFLLTCATAKGSAEQHSIFMEQANGNLYHMGTNGSSSGSPPAYKKIWDSGNLNPQSALSTYEQSYTRNHASVSYTEHLRCWRYGNVVTLGGYFSCAGSIAANTLLYTLPSPKFVIYFTAKNESANRMYNFNLQTNGQLKTNEAIAGGNYLVCFTYVCA